MDEIIEDKPRSDEPVNHHDGSKDGHSNQSVNSGLKEDVSKEEVATELPTSPKEVSETENQLFEQFYPEVPAQTSSKSVTSIKPVSSSVTHRNSLISAKISKSRQLVKAYKARIVALMSPQKKELKRASPLKSPKKILSIPKQVPTNLKITEDDFIEDSDDERLMSIVESDFEDDLLEEIPTPLPVKPSVSITSLDSKLSKFGVTMRRVIVPTAKGKYEVIPQPANAPSSSSKAPTVVTYRLFPPQDSSSSSEGDKPCFVPKILPKPPQKLLVRKGILSSQEGIRPVWKFVNAKKLATAASSSTVSPPECVDFPSQSPEPPSHAPSGFPKAIVYPSEVKTIEKISVPPPKAIIYPKSAETEPAPKPSEVKNPENLEEEPATVCIDLGANVGPLITVDVPGPSPKFTMPSKRSKITKTEVPANQKDEDPEPDPFKYLIPQDLIAADDDRVKIPPFQTFEDPMDVSDPTVLFEEEIEEPPPAPRSKPVQEDIPRNRRKTALNPIAGDPEFSEGQQQTTKNKKRQRTTGVPEPVEKEQDPDEEALASAPRPQANIELMENLSWYRALINELFDRLQMPQIDFNEVGDDYVNTYKLLRN